MSTIAVFLAMATGGAYAANTIGSPDVIDNSLLSADIKDGEIKAADIGTSQVLGSRIVDGTIKSFDVDNNSLTGWDINESTLGVVPQASSSAFSTAAGHATTADKAGVQDYEVLWQSAPLDGVVRKEREFELNCPSGKRPIGGGGTARTTAYTNDGGVPAGAEVAVVESAPSGGNIYAGEGGAPGYMRPTGWRIKAQATDRANYNAGINLNVYVVCAKTDMN